MVDQEPTYACGNTPMVGDLIEFGTRHTRMLVTRVFDSRPEYSIECGGSPHLMKGKMFDLMVLIARHGQMVPENHTVKVSDTEVVNIEITEHNNWPSDVKIVSDTDNVKQLAILMADANAEILNDLSVKEQGRYLRMARAVSEFYMSAK